MRFFFCFLNFFIFLSNVSSQKGLGAKRMSVLPKYGPSPLVCNSYSPFIIATTSSYPPFQMIIYSTSDVVSNTIGFHRNYELFNSYFMLNVLSQLQSATLVDFGANLGWFSLLAASKNFSTISIEAIPCNYWGFTESIKLNKFENLIKHYNLALSTNDQESICVADSITQPSNQGNSFLSPQEHAAKIIVNNCPPHLLVKTSPLISLIPPQTNIGFLKADCEGCELSVLFASKELFQSSSAPCAIMVEWTPKLVAQFLNIPNPSEMMKSFWDMLIKSGYVIVEFILGTHSLRILQPDSKQYQSLYSGDRTESELKAILTTDRCFPRNSEKWNKLFSTI